MLVHVPKILDEDTVRRSRRVLLEASWQDGRATAGHQSARVKENLQLGEDDPRAIELGQVVLRALERSPLFVSAVLPQRVFPPLFNRYEAGMAFGAHVDNALRAPLGSPARLRTDVSGTLFLCDPGSYEGGELIVEDTYGSHSVKLPAGDLIVYPASSLHRVAPVTSGVRLAAFFWVQSLVRDVGQRALLFDMDMAIQALDDGGAGRAPVTVLTGVYHNLLRRWAET